MRKKKIGFEYYPCAQDNQARSKAKNTHVDPPKSTTYPVCPPAIHNSTGSLLVMNHQNHFQLLACTKILNLEEQRDIYPDQKWGLLKLLMKQSSNSTIVLYIGS